MSGETAKALMSLFLGLCGVALARTVFLSRERRTTGRTQPWRETLPLTLMAMLVTGVVVWERKMSLSLSVFTGLGVGWSAILLLDLFGDWVLRTGRRIAGVTDAERGIPPEQSRLLDKVRDPEERENPEEPTP